MASSTPDILRLPPELLFEICHLLPSDAILSLKLTHSTFNNLLPALSQFRKNTSSKCARYAIERHCITSSTPRDRLRCIFCKCTYPLSTFVSSNSPACLPVSFVEGVPKPEVVEIPFSFCGIHVSRLARAVQTEPGGRNEWVSDIRSMCLHDGCIQGWHDCRCSCDSCGYKMVRTYTRYRHRTIKCRLFRFWRNTAAGESEDPQEKIKGRLYVREHCRDNATQEESIVDLPVHYQDQENADCSSPWDRAVPFRSQNRRSNLIDFDRVTTFEPSVWT